MWSEPCCCCDPPPSTLCLSDVAPVTSASSHFCQHYKQPTTHDLSCCCQHSPAPQIFPKTSPHSEDLPWALVWKSIHDTFITLYFPYPVLCMCAYVCIWMYVCHMCMHVCVYVCTPRQSLPSGISPQKLRLYPAHCYISPSPRVVPGNVIHSTNMYWIVSSPRFL